jgi:DNA-binding NarL/FixJ family response regulator
MMISMRSQIPPTNSAPSLLAHTRSDPANADLEKLSPREREVLLLLVQGFLYKEIGHYLKVSYATVHTHIRHIYKKLGVNSRAKAVAIFHARIVNK